MPLGFQSDSLLHATCGFALSARLASPSATLADFSNSSAVSRFLRDRHRAPRPLLAMPDRPAHWRPAFWRPLLRADRPQSLEPRRQRGIARLDGEIRQAAILLDQRIVAPLDFGLSVIEGLGLFLAHPLRAPGSVSRSMSRSLPTASAWPELAIGSPSSQFFASPSACGFPLRWPQSWSRQGRHCHRWALPQCAPAPIGRWGRREPRPLSSARHGRGQDARTRAWSR